MPTSVGEIGLDLVVNQKQFNAQMNNIAATAKKAGTILAAAFSIKAIVNFGKECLELGSDLAEVQNVVDVTFSTMSSKVDEFAKGALTTYGLSETMAKQYTGTFGAMAKAFGFTEDQAYDMSTALTGLAGDVASFYNISQDLAYTKLKSVFSGETETLKDLGIVMTQNALDAYAMANGFGKTTSQMTEAEKVMLRYQFVSEQLSAAQGDFSRTSGSWANQVRILKLQFDSLKATIGQGLINLFTPIIKAVNTLIGKLATLANAFKSFTELLTGQKGSGTSSTVSNLGDTAETASAGLDDASSAADSLASSNDGVADSAKKASKAMMSLMGFDEINQLSSSDSDSDATSSSPSSSGSGSAGSLGNSVDFGNLAQGETVVDKTSSAFDGLIKRCKELAALFKKGFKIGFGDSEKTIKSIIKSIKNIGKSLKDIFTDSDVVTAANKCMDAVAEAIGKVVGSVASVGLSIADNLVGGFEKYLEQSSGFIKEQLVKSFDATAEISTLIGNFSVAFEDLFTIFQSESAKQITADFISIFYNAFFGATTLINQFIADFLNIFITPFTENIDLIKLTLENALGTWVVIFDTIAQSVTDTVAKIIELYDTYISPFFQSISDGISSILNTFLTAWNKHMSPVLDKLADKFSKVWAEHVQPAFNGVLELAGKVFQALQALWENILVPLINWITRNILPIISPIVQALGNIILNLMGIIGDVITNVTSILSGFLDFVSGVFSGDWKKCWDGIGEIVSGFRDLLSDLFSGLVNLFKPAINSIISLFNSIIGVMNGLINKINSISFKITIPSWIPGIGGSWFGFNGFNIPTVGTIPQLAQGAYVRANTPQLAMIGDNMHQGEFVAPEDKLQAMALSAAKAAGGSGISKDELAAAVAEGMARAMAMIGSVGSNSAPEYAMVNISVGENELARAVAKVQNKLNSRMSPSPAY